MLVKYPGESNTLEQEVVLVVAAHLEGVEGKERAGGLGC